MVVIDESAQGARQGLDGSGGVFGSDGEEEGKAGKDDEGVELNNLRINSPDDADDGAED